MKNIKLPNVGRPEFVGNFLAQQEMNLEFVSNSKICKDCLYQLVFKDSDK